MFFVSTPLICRMKRNLINELDSSFFRDRKQIINNQPYIIKQSGTKLFILDVEVRSEVDTSGPKRAQVETSRHKWTRLETSGHK